MADFFLLHFCDVAVPQRDLFEDYTTNVTPIFTVEVEQGI
jgi:hypothetical protein